MTDQKSDRQDGAGLRPLDPRVIIAGIRQFGLAPDGADLRDLETAFTTQPTRDGAEGTGLKTFDPRDAGFTLQDCGCRENECEGRTDGTCHHPTLEAAPPKPAPDAMREVRARLIYEAANPSDPKDAWREALRISDAIAVLSAPVPPADGARESYCSPNIGPQPGEIGFKGYNHKTWLSVASEPVAWRRESLAQAFALHRWNAKLENLPDDMKDGCYAFAGSVLSDEQ